MSDWSKAKREERVTTNQDIFFEYLKFACFLLLCSVYFYYIFWS